MKRYNSYILAVAVAVVALAGCKKEDPNRTPFDNKVYVNTKQKEEMLIKKDIRTATRTIQASLAKPADQNITLTYAVEPSLVSVYNNIYYDTAILLEEQFYELTESTATIAQGSVRSSDIEINFNGIDALDRNLVYVLPVKMVSATNVDILNSARTSYFVFKGGALINVVADLESSQAVINWTNSAAVKNMTQITLEALVKLKYITRKGSDSEIISIMGTESYYLIRLGDSNAAGQIQLATTGGNVPAKDATKALPVGQWVHIAVTHDLTSGAYIIYVDGVKQSEGTNTVSGKKLDLTTPGGGEKAKGFKFGASWNNNRWLAGEISEARIWNVVRTQQQIAENFYQVAPDEVGLVGYWKFDDGAGLTIKDHTANGNNAKVPEDLPCKWNPVSLPVIKK